MGKTQLGVPQFFSNVLMGDLIPKGKHQCEIDETLPEPQRGAMVE